MNERPILFSGEMVRAILAGRKTQTRRPVAKVSANNPNNQPIATCAYEVIGPSKDDPSEFGFLTAGDQGFEFVKCPLGQPGDRLWVRETWRPSIGLAPTFSGYASEQCGSAFRADNGFIAVPLASRFFGADWTNSCGKWRPSIHMPRWASRITLEVVAVRVERLRDISEADAMAEGIETVSGLPTVNAVADYAVLWNSLYAARGYGWDVNPWVWVVEFKRVKVTG